MSANRITNLFEPEGEDLPLCLDEILPHLNTERIGRNLRILEEIDSTNSYLSREMEGLPDGSVAVAELQTAGRGRRGRSWISPKGANLMFSLLLREDPTPPQISTLIGALAVANKVNETREIVSLKWPNDLVSLTPGPDGSDRTLGGVLCESKTDRAGTPVLILGVGVNVNSSETDFPEDVRNRATSLKSLSGRRWNRNRLLAAILNEIESLLMSADRSGTERLVDAARRMCSTVGKRVQILIGEREVEGDAIDLDSLGRLLVRDKTGSVAPVELGEVVRTRPLLE